MVFENEEMSEKPLAIIGYFMAKKSDTVVSIMIVSLYLVLTFVILLSSIDNIQFAAHELYGHFYFGYFDGFYRMGWYKSPKTQSIIVWITNSSADYGIDLGQ